jgi:hypothetical protein
MVAPKSCHECATTKVVVALDLVVSAMYSALHSNFFSVLCSDILACFHSSLELFYSTLQLANNWNMEPAAEWVPSNFQLGNWRTGPWSSHQLGLLAAFPHRVRIHWDIWYLDLDPNLVSLAISPAEGSLLSAMHMPHSISQLRRQKKPESRLMTFCTIWRWRSITNSLPLHDCLSSYYRHISVWN